MANRFTDPLGRRWEVAIDPPRAEAVRASLGLALPALLEQDGKPLSALLDSPPMLAGVLYALCSQVTPGEQVSLEEFTACVSEPSTLQEAAGAFCQALWDAYCPGEGYTVCQVSRRDRAWAERIDRATPEMIDTTPAFYRPKGPGERRP